MLVKKKKQQLYHPYLVLPLIQILLDAMVFNVVIPHKLLLYYINMIRILRTLQ